LWIGGQSSVNIGPMTTERTRFDRWAPRYDRSILQRFMFEPVHQAALRAFEEIAGGPPHDILDAGCGTGRLLEAAAQRWSGTRLTGIDPSEGMIAQARGKHEGDTRFTFKLGDAAALPLEPAAFDAAFSTISFHHWSDQAAGVRELARVLRPGGLFVLADIDVPFLFLLHPLLSLTRHVHMQDRRSIQRFLEGAGFSIVLRRRVWPLSPVVVFVARL
jgi:ubiquinone/menaquinone biosynthesis C-methylase UbiE